MTTDEMSGDMTGPTTTTGKMLAAFLRGLLPETRQFDAQIADIENQARADAADAAAADRQEVARLREALEAVTRRLPRSPAHRGWYIDHEPPYGESWMHLEDEPCPLGICQILAATQPTPAARAALAPATPVAEAVARWQDDPDIVIAINKAYWSGFDAGRVPTDRNPPWCPSHGYLCNNDHTVDPWDPASPVAEADGTDVCVCTHARSVHREPGYCDAIGGPFPWGGPDRKCACWGFRAAPASPVEPAPTHDFPAMSSRDMALDRAALAHPGPSPAVEVHVNTGAAHDRAMAWSEGHTAGYEEAQQEVARLTWMLARTYSLLPPDRVALVDDGVSEAVESASPTHPWPCDDPSKHRSTR